MLGALIKNQNQNQNKRDTRKLLEAMDMFTTLIVVMVP